jgi:hypothetical protein
VLRWHDDALAAGRQGRQRIDGEGMFREHRGASRRQENAGDEIEHVVGAVAEHDLLLACAEPLGQRRGEVELVRITLDAVHRRLHRRAGARTHAERVLIGGQLDDLVDRNTHFARQLGDRLARLVG